MNEDYKIGKVFSPAACTQHSTIGEYYKVLNKLTYNTWTTELGLLEDINKGKWQALASRNCQSSYTQASQLMLHTIGRARPNSDTLSRSSLPTIDLGDAFDGHCPVEACTTPCAHPASSSVSLVLAFSLN